MTDASAYDSSNGATQFANLWRFYSAVRSFATIHELPGCTADDIVQETYLRAYRSLHAHRSLSRPLGYLLSIAWAVLTDNRRRSQRQFRDAELLDDLSFVHDPNAHEPLIVSERRESIDRLLDCVDELPEDRRELLRDFYQLEKSCKQIGRELGIRHANVKVRLHRTRKRLRQLLEGGDQE